jgi:predicted enzyme related to lactoylglutathione lyase
MSDTLNGAFMKTEETGKESRYSIFIQVDDSKKKARTIELVSLKLGSSLIFKNGGTVVSQTDLVDFGCEVKFKDTEGNIFSVFEYK